MDCHYSREEGGKGRLLRADHVKESRFFAFSLPASAATPKRAGGAGGRACSRSRASCHSLAQEHLWGTSGRPDAGWKRREGLLCLQEPPLIPSGVEGKGSGSQPRLPPPPGNLTAMSEADNVRGQEATHLKPYLESRAEA